MLRVATITLRATRSRLGSSRSFSQLLKPHGPPPHRLLQPRPTRSLIQKRTFWGNSNKFFTDEKVIPYSPSEAFSVISQVEKYKEFLPWCFDGKITQANPQQTKGALVIGTQGFKNVKVDAVDNQKFVLSLEPDNENPLDKLQITFHLAQAGGNQTKVNFSFEYSFKSSLHAMMAQSTFAEIQESMIRNIEKRCSTLFIKK